ncbi:Rid family hydrolase [Rhizobium bangladeshense]|uniref:Rid family hydrolase n=1 Tax=Rhizobium bangladeshense TaxID=1138189 RepID=UPI002180B9CC|nr:Rid family hydrolase [Rhizobium bangladeshense]
MTNFLSFPRLFSILLWLAGGLVILFLIAPIVAIVPLSFNAEPFFTYPMPGLSLRWCLEFFDSNVWQLALKNSIIVAVFATLLSTLLSTLAAIGLSRPSCPARATLTAILILPMIVPVIVSAVGIYYAVAEWLQQRAERQKIAHRDWSRILSMQIERYEIGKRMSQTVIYGGFVFLAGQVAIDAPGSSVREQTTNILARITWLLERAGSDPTRILSATIWLADMSGFEEMNAAWDAWVPSGHAPARATVEARLAARDSRWKSALSQRPAIDRRSSRSDGRERQGATSNRVTRISPAWLTRTGSCKAATLANNRPKGCRATCLCII